MELTEREILVRDYMVKYVVPTIKNIIENGNPGKFQAWNKNCCQQIAVFGAKYLQKLLPNYEWSVWYGHFYDIYNGERVYYNHAWNYGIDRENKRRLFVDFAKLYTEPLFIITEKNAYPKDGAYVNLKEDKRERLDFDKMIKTEKEYFTGYTGDEFLREIHKMIDKEFADNMLDI